MSKSRKTRRHFLEDQMSLYNSIRKPLPPSVKVHADDKDKRKKRFDWRNECDTIDND